MLMNVRDADSGEGMSDRQIRDEIMTIFLAGHETTASALAWTWYLLSQHPDVETQLHEELRTVLGGRTPAVQDLPSLGYTLGNSFAMLEAQLIVAMVTQQFRPRLAPGQVVVVHPRATLRPYPTMMMTL